MIDGDAGDKDVSYAYDYVVFQTAVRATEHVGMFDCGEFPWSHWAGQLGPASAPSPLHSHIRLEGTPTGNPRPP